MHRHEKPERWLFQVGFENGTWLPNIAGAPLDVRTIWDSDEIQALASKFASELFEVHLRFGERDGQEFPVLEVEPGVRSPVASKRNLLEDPKDSTSKKLVKEHQVYVRSLLANGTASTSEAKYGDLPDLSRRCFDNLEADVGRFVRTQLGSINPEAARVLAEVLAVTLNTQAPPGPSEPSPAERAATFLYDGHDRFQREKARRGLTTVPRHGALEAAAIIDGDVPPVSPTTEFLNRLNAANPRYTGWPLWLDSRGFANHGDDPVPYTLDGGWETFLYNCEPGSWYNHLDFWRAEPGGQFYLYRAFEDDISEGKGYPEAMTTLDFGMAIWRATEAIAVPMAFARAMGLAPEKTTMFYAFRWSGLRGRYLSSWTKPGRYLSSRYECRQDIVESSPIAVSLDTPVSALGPFVREATTGLFAAFGGFELGEGVTENLADELLVRGRRAG